MLAKTYRDDEYYTTVDAAKKFFELVVIPSGILKHKTILMPFSNGCCPLYLEAIKHHNNVIGFSDDRELWRAASNFEDCAVVDNPPFSLSVKLERFYFDNHVPFILFRSAVTYPKFFLNQGKAGVVYENSKSGVQYTWGLAQHIGNDQYIADTYPNLIDNLKGAGILEKSVPTCFGFYLTDYNFKINTVTFSELNYPLKGDMYIYMNGGVYDENSKIWESSKDGRIHAMSKVKKEVEDGLN